jgi:hypothetical protein
MKFVSVKVDVLCVSLFSPLLYYKGAAALGRVHLF